MRTAVKRGDLLVGYHIGPLDRHPAILRPLIFQDFFNLACYSQFDLLTELGLQAFRQRHRALQAEFVAALQVAFHHQDADAILRRSVFSVGAE